MPWWNGVETYAGWKPLDLPFEAERHNITIEHFGLGCVECGHKVERLRGKFVEHHNCIEVLCGGVCHDCRLITYGRLRWYEDNRLLHQARDGWHTHMMVPAHPVREFFRRLCKKIGSLLGGLDWHR